LRGKAGRGDKTILDVLYPAIEAMRSEYEQGHEAKQVFAAVYDTAKKGLEETKNTVAKFGRPAYYGEKTIGRQDPGGTAGLYIIEGIVNYITRIHP
jgi:dihydroxyacetone kinase-like protein